MKFPTHAGPHAIGPGALDQYATRKRIACLGNSGAPDGASERAFAGDQAEIGHQLASIGEASKWPTSATTVTATTRATPRIAWSAAATGAIDQLGISSSICRVSRSRLDSVSSTAWI